MTMTIHPGALKDAITECPRGMLISDNPPLDLLVHNALFGGEWRFADQVVREMWSASGGHAILPSYTTDVACALALASELAPNELVWDLVSRATTQARKWPSYMPEAYEWGLILAREIVYQTLLAARKVASKVAA